MTFDSSNLEAIAQNQNTAPEVLRQLAFTSIPLRRLVASNPSADATLLAELSKIKDKDNVTQQYIALNPNTSPDILIKLFSKHPHQVLNNPTLDLLLLENSNFYEELCHSNYRDLKQYEVLFLINRASTPGELIENLALDNNPHVRCQVAASYKTSNSTLKLLAKDKCREVKIAVISNVNTPVKTLESLASDEDEHIRRLIAQETEISILTLEALSKDKSILVRKCVAENISTPSYILKNLANDSEFYVRRYVEANPNVTEDILKLLIKDKDSYICYKSAQKLLPLISASQNKDDAHYINTSEDIIKKFSPRFAET